MNKFLLAIFFCSTLFSLSAQSEFSWGVQVTPNFSHRRLIAQDVISREQVNMLEELEIARLSYNTGVTFRWKSERVGFQTGLNFMTSGHRTRRVSIENSDPAPPGATEKRTDYKSLFIEAPAELQFIQKLNDKNYFFFMMGVTLAYNIDNATNTIFYTGESQEVVAEPTDNSQFSSVNYSFITGMGWEHEFNESFSLVLQPTFQFWLRPLLNDIDLDLNRNLYSVGVRVQTLF